MNKNNFLKEKEALTLTPNFMDSVLSQKKIELPTEILEVKVPEILKTKLEEYKNIYFPKMGEIVKTPKEKMIRKTEEIEKETKKIPFKFEE